MFLLTDRYPPFSLDDEDYPIRFLAAPNGQLNRLAVFFRLLLVIPASLVVGLALGGMEVAAFVIWLIVLIAGEPPEGLYLAMAAVIRYLARVYGYFMLLTSTYPRAVRRSAGARRILGRGRGVGRCARRL